METFGHQIISKRTIAPLFDFMASVQGTHDLGNDVILRETDHSAIREEMNTSLSTLRGETGESFTTYLSSPERDEFEAAVLCLEHRFDAPDYVGQSEELSWAQILSVVTAMRIVKPTLVKPGLRLGWENRGGIWQLRGFFKAGFDVYHAEEEWFEPFTTEDVTSLREMMSRVHQAYIAHGQGDFNRVANSLNFFESGYRSNWIPVRFVMFTTALESLFITSDDGVGRQFRERISRFLGQDLADRQQLEDNCRAIYATRSDIVHGQPIAGGRTTIDRLMLDVQRIGRSCLQKVLKDDALFAKFCGPRSDLGRFLTEIP